MKKILLFALALTAICCMTSCKKSHWGKKYITFGDTKNMIVVEYDSTFLRYYFHQEEDPTSEDNDLICDTSLDLDDDGYDDLFFYSRFGNSWLDFYFNSINEEYLSITNCHYSNITGSLYWSSSTSYITAFYSDIVYTDYYWYTDTTVLHHDDTTILVIENYCNVFKTSNNNGGYPTYTFHLSNAGDQLFEDERFESRPRPLYAYPFEAYGEDYTSNDTIYYQATYVIDTSFDFPLDEEKYIGFFLETNGSEKLGWIKIKLESQPDGTHRMRLLETAIQE